MDAFIGKWKATAADITGGSEFGKATGQSEIIDTYLKGYETEVVKSGENWVLSTLIGGKVVSKETINLGGKYTIEMPGVPKPLEAQLSVKVEGSKVTTEGTVGGQHTKTIRYIEGGNFITDMYSNSANMTAKMSKV